MKLIDEATKQRILDTANIVEVVSDFVTLKKRGANYIGLCPFHNERTPSFSVSPSKGYCKCFSCGKGGSAVGFLMEHEQMTFQEALRYLARKYHIEIKEHELSDKERAQITERESLLAVNDFALKHFEHNLSDTPDGRDIGLAYFRERGINDAMIARFRLGYAIDSRDDLLRAARARGFDEKYLVETGLCARSERGTVYDRFKGRVIYPVFSVSGRVVAFGGRTLRSDKNVAKYVNSPESAIYHKSNEVYGLYQAKNAIARKNKCILVEGYMDVISMHQVGVDNVVASSGTSLTDGQIRMIHRFTENVTVIYDSDPAGIKASLRGIDLLLAQGLNIKVLLLPDGEDPDSFAQKHTGEEVERYIAEHERDFMQFKTELNLREAAGDPIARARVINDIVRSISVIPDAVLRAEYIKECSRLLEISDQVLILQTQKMMAERIDEQYRRKPIGQEGATTPAGQQTEAPTAPNETPPATNDVHTPSGPAQAATSNPLYEPEKVLMKYVVKYGLLWVPPYSQNPDDPMQTVQQFVADALDQDSLHITDPTLRRVYDTVADICTGRWPAAAAAYEATLADERARLMAEGQEIIRREARDLADIEARERTLADSVEADIAQRREAYAEGYLEQLLISSEDDTVRVTCTDLVAERYQLSKVHTRYSKVETERDRLPELLWRGVLELKLAVLNELIKAEKARMYTIDPADKDAINDCATQIAELFKVRIEFARELGERIIAN